MTAGTVVITGGILATVILLCIIAVLCYCRLQVRPRDREGDQVGVELEGWLLRESHLTRVQDRMQEGAARLQGRHTLQWGQSVSVLFSGQLCNSLKALAEAQRVPRT